MDNFEVYQLQERTQVQHEVSSIPNFWKPRHRQTIQNRIERKCNFNHFKTFKHRNRTYTARKKFVWKSVTLDGLNEMEQQEISRNYDNYERCPAAHKQEFNKLRKYFLQSKVVSRIRHSRSGEQEIPIGKRPCNLQFYNTSLAKILCNKKIIKLAHDKMEYESLKDSVLFSILKLVYKRNVQFESNDIINNINTMNINNKYLQKDGEIIDLMTNTHKTMTNQKILQHQTQAKEAVEKLQQYWNNSNTNEVTDNDRQKMERRIESIQQREQEINRQNCQNLTPIDVDNCNIAKIKPLSVLSLCPIKIEK